MIVSGIDAHRLVTLFEEAITRLGVEIRYESFGRDALGITSRGGARGGLCKIRGQLVVLLDEQLGAVDKVSVLARALSAFDLETIDLPPVVRATIRAHVDGAPAKLRPLAKAHGPRRR